MLYLAFDLGSFGLGGGISATFRCSRKKSGSSMEHFSTESSSPTLLIAGKYRGKASSAISGWAWYGARATSLAGWVGSISYIYLLQKEKLLQNMDLGATSVPKDPRSKAKYNILSRLLFM